MRFEFARPESAFEARRDEWRALVPACRSATPFQTPEWVEIWAKHYLGRREPRTLFGFEGNDLMLVYPLMAGVGPWRTLRPMGIGPSDYLHPLIAPGSESATNELAAFLSDLPGFDIVDLQQIRSDRAAARPQGATCIEQARCLVLDLPDTYDQFLATLGKSLRFDVRKLGKEPFASGNARISTATVDSVGDGLSILFEQHRKRWRKRGLPGVFFGRAARFHQQWAHVASKNGWLRLQVLEVQGVPIGALYGMALGETTYFYQCGFDPAYSTMSPGTLLVGDTIRQAIEEGRRTFDFLRGDEPYKRRWKPQSEYPNQRFILPGAGLRGRIGLSWNDRMSRIEQRLRARFEGKGLR